MNDRRPAVTPRSPARRVSRYKYDIRDLNGAPDPHRMAPLCCQDARAAVGVAFLRGPGCGFTEEPAVGVEPVALVFRVAPMCPPGPPNASSASATKRR